MKKKQNEVMLQPLWTKVNYVTITFIFLLNEQFSDVLPRNQHFLSEIEEK